MTARDRAVVLVLVAALAVITVGIGAPAFGPPPNASPQPSDVTGSSSPPVVTAYREGLIGRPASINPLTAQSQVDRDIVALVYSGLMKLGPDGTIVPDLASGYSVSQKGASYTFSIRPDARWQDAAPVTSADVVYTILALQDPAYTGPGASSWREVTVTAVDDLTVRFDLATPLGGFLQAATQPLLPEHLLRDVAAANLATAPFNDNPIGSGPYRLVSWDALAAHLELVAPVGSNGFPAPTAGASPGGSGPAASTAQGGSSAPDASAAATGSAQGAASSPAATKAASPGATGAAAGTSASPSPTPQPTPPPGSSPLTSIDFRFYSDDAALMADYRAGLVDSAPGLTPGDAKTLVATPGSRWLAYPRSTYTGVILNLRPGHLILQQLVLRRALLQAIDRSKLIAAVLAGSGHRADTPIPPSSWAFDPTAAPAVAFDRAAAAKALRKAGWTKPAAGWTAPKARVPFAIELITPDEASNPIVFATTNAIADDWRAFGIRVTVTALTPHDFIDSRIAPGHFDAAVADVDVGLDPDLYPFLASTQTTTGGANVSGVQLPALDQKLSAARRYGSHAARVAAFKDLQTYLGAATFTLPLFFRDEVVVVSDRLWGPTPREIGDPSGRFWDVLTWRLANGR